MDATETSEQHSRLAHYPIPLFGMIMGLSGLAIATHAFERAYGFSGVAHTGLYYFAFAMFGAIGAGYLAKAIRHPGAVTAEWSHPVRLAFFPAISISLLLLSAASLSHNIAVAHGLWIVGMALQFVFTIAVVSSWIGSRSFQHGALNPAWFIPAVGNVVVPIAGAQLGYVEVSWYFMAVGLIFWIVLLTLVFNRLVFHDPLPEKLQPTLVILIAPPAVAFVAWVKLTGDVDAFARILINCAYLFSMIVMVQLPRILRLPFSLSFWALSFPIAAVSIASFLFAHETGSLVHRVFGTVFWAALCIIIAGLLMRTFRAAMAGKICVPE